MTEPAASRTRIIEAARSMGPQSLPPRSVQPVF